jgi:hypothetical protein
MNLRSGGLFLFNAHFRQKVLKKTHFAGSSLQLEPSVCCSLNKRKPLQTYFFFPKAFLFF